MLKYLQTFVEFNPEQCPKWQALTEILKVEIITEMKTKNVNENNILILCQDTRTCFQLNQVHLWYI